MPEVALPPSSVPQKAQTPQARDLEQLPEGLKLAEGELISGSPQREVFLKKPVQVEQESEMYFPRYLHQVLWQLNQARFVQLTHFSQCYRLLSAHWLFFDPELPLSQHRSLDYRNCYRSH